MAIIINVISHNDELIEEQIYNAFNNVKSVSKKIYSIEKRNIIRDGIGDKINTTLDSKIFDVENNIDYVLFVETMLRVSLLYYDQLLYFKNKSMKRVILTNISAEELYIYLLSKIKRNSDLSLNEISQWLDCVFKPIIWSDCVIIPYFISKFAKIDSVCFDAYNYVIKHKVKSVIELPLDEQGGVDYLQLTINKLLEKGEIRCE